MHVHVCVGHSLKGAVFRYICFVRSSERLAVVSGTILTFVKQTMPQIEDKLVKWMTRTLFCAISVISMTTLAWHFNATN